MYIYISIARETGVTFRAPDVDWKWGKWTFVTLSIMPCAVVTALSFGRIQGQAALPCLPWVETSVERHFRSRGKRHRIYSSQPI